MSWQPVGWWILLLTCSACSSDLTGAEQAGDGVGGSGSGASSGGSSAGQGTGDHMFDIVPGRPEDSILIYRMASLDPGAMMPELGRGTVHEEGVALVRDWITAWLGGCSSQDAQVATK